MAAKYDNIAKQFKQFKESPFCLYVEAYTYLNLVGDVAGKSLLDLACGEGFYTRILALLNQNMNHAIAPRLRACNARNGTEPYLR